MNLRLDALTAEQCEQARQWRNLTPEVWRTPFLLTEEQQYDFYKNIVCDRAASSRYWAVLDYQEKFPTGDPPIFVGMVGLVPISWPDAHGEVSICIDPNRRGGGVGRQAIRLLLEEAFHRLRLCTVIAEVYESNEPALAFWRAIADEYAAHVTRLPRRKFWAGKLWASLLVTIAREDFDAVVDLPGGQNASA